MARHTNQRGYRRFSAFQQPVHRAELATHPLWRRLSSVLLSFVIAQPAAALPPRVIEINEHKSRLRAMWLGQSIGTWTGRRSEGRVQNPPFLTDGAWGTNLGGGTLQYVVGLNPWPGDDDTDVEYVSLHAMTTSGTPWLTPEVLANAWLLHMDDAFLWVSNLEALRLMRRGVLPPSTGLPASNQFWLRIDAQLTTEIFGALAPGLPEIALRLADIPIMNTAGGHAAHAAQFFVVLYALGATADHEKPPTEEIERIYAEARRLIPDTSKAADIADFVLADYLANPDKDDWERTRDLVYDRYQLNASTHGFRYRGWTESSVNFAAGLIALLYGGGDFLRTIQIGTLSGWDSDNGTATMGGLIGLMVGYDALVLQIESALGPTPLSDRYDIERTRNNIPPYLEGDPLAQDTFTLMAGRMLSLTEQIVREADGKADPRVPFWVLPRPAFGPQMTLNPLTDRWLSSATTRVRHAGGSVTPGSTALGSPPAGHGSGVVARISNGLDLDGSGLDVLNDANRLYFTTEGAAIPPSTPISLTVLYDREVAADMVRFIEGDHFDNSGGWFESFSVEVRTGGGWTTITPTPLSQSTGRPFEMIDIPLGDTLQISGIRLTGIPGGPDRFVTCAELDALRTPSVVNRPGFDLNSDGKIDIEDLYFWHALGTNPSADLDSSGFVDGHDREYLEAVVRWLERQDMEAGRRP